MKRLRALSECCICLTTYTDPRMLPCFHTACLKCFEDIQLKNGKKPGELLPCPLCRNEFQIPPDGMKGLQRNFFIESLMELADAFNLENKSRPCTMCSMIEEFNVVAQATMRCLNCCENYCRRCSKIHKTLKATKDHKIAELNIEVTEEEIRNMFPIRKCVRHSDKVLDYYCSDCKTVVCVSCLVKDHKTHECKDVTTVDKEFRHKIEQSFTKMYDNREDILSKKYDLERKKRDFLAKVLETESAIRHKNQQLKALIDQHTEELLNELTSLKQHREKKIDAEIEEIERKLTVQESFVTFCTELKSKGSPSEVCGSVDCLIARAKELRKENDEYLRAPSKPVYFEFTVTDHNAGNIIGKLSGNKKKSRKKNRDLNSKGKVLLGTYMDAFIDGSEADEEKSKSRKSSSPSSMTAVEAAEEAAEADVVVVVEERLTDGAGTPQDDPLSISTSFIPDVQPRAEYQGKTRPEAENKEVVFPGESKRSAAQDVAASISNDLQAEGVNVEVDAAPQKGDGDVTRVTVNDIVSASLDKSEVCLVPGKSGVVGKVSADAEVVQTPDDAAGLDKDREGDDPEVGTELELPASMLSKSSNKTDLKYTYSENQWSPLNPEGKKQYNRSFMLQLQFANPSIIRPAGLPCLPYIILNEPRVKNDFSRQNSHNDPSSPIEQNLGAGSIGRSSLKKGGGGGGGSGIKRAAEQQRNVINVGLEHNITLNTSENAWKPILGKPSLKEGGSPTEELYKQIRGILDELTPQTFQALIQQVQHLPINTEERLTGCVDIIFEKAISEPNFSVAYANMARCLMSISVPLVTDPSQMVAFRKLLLNKCQQEFEKDKAEEHDIEALENQIAEASSDEKRNTLTELRDAAIYRAKHRSLGNIRFIGELFKLKMLTEAIMHECLKKLLKSYKDENSLECLCQLLTTIGQDIDKKQPGTSIMNKYFNNLKDLVDQKKTSARIRFMIQDMIELRKNKWAPRRQNNNPKTIEQIHKEAEQEEQEKQMALHKFTQDQRNRRTTPTPNRGPPIAQNPHTTDDGWAAVGRAPKTIVDPSQMKLTKQPMDENFQLGPGGKAMSAWHRGSNEWAKAQESEKPISTPNRFSVLGGFGSESTNARSRPNNRIGSGYTGRLFGPQSRTQASKHSQERTGHESSFFLQEQQLQFTEKVPEETGRGLSSDEVLERLAKILEGPDSAPEKLIDCIDDSVDEETACSTSFIRAFTSSLCFSCIILQKSPTVDQTKLKKLLPALSKYTKSNKALEAQVLYALQALAHKLEHPPGLLMAFFDTLYDEDVISLKSFLTGREALTRVSLLERKLPFKQSFLSSTG